MVCWNGYEQHVLGLGAQHVNYVITIIYGNSLLSYGLLCID